MNNATLQTAEGHQHQSVEDFILPAHCRRDLIRKMLVLLTAILSLHGAPDSLFADEVDDIRQYYQKQIADLNHGAEVFEAQKQTDLHSLKVAESKLSSARNSDDKAAYTLAVASWKQKVESLENNITDNARAVAKLTIQMTKEINEAKKRKAKEGNLNVEPLKKGKASGVR